MDIIVRYSCAGCGLHRVEVRVPARQVEGIAFWITQILGRAIGVDHAKRSPGCPSRKMSEVMIPMPPGAATIGGPPLN